jgi:hypothetical protein
MVWILFDRPATRAMNEGPGAMDYSRLIQDAGEMAWRHRFLWVLGLFAGGSGACGGGFGGNFNIPRGFDGSDSDTASNETANLRDVSGDIGGWLAGHFTLLLVIAAIALAVLAVFLLTAIIAQGGIAWATAELARGRPAGFRSSVRAGVRLAPRFFGLWLLLGGVALGAWLLVGGFGVVFGYLFFTEAGSGRAIGGLGLVLVSVAALSLAIASVPLTVIIAYAQRAVAVDDTGVVASIERALRLLRARLGPSLVVWVILFALSIGVGIAITIGVVIVVVIVAVAALVVWLLAGVWLTLVLVGAAGSALLGVLLAASGVINAFTWSYWTLAYLRLRDVAAAAPVG